jgi:hypothetical protein
MITPTEQDYPGIVHTLVQAAGSFFSLATAVDVPELRRICERFETIAPITEPTAYARGGLDNLRDQADFLRAVDGFVTALHRLERQPTSETTR